ncbi:glycosyltransferase family 39 protein [Clostridium taeniosporum]|uniref:Dolichyl-phosphate-mannose--protein mannosyltransferase n=1 Tax=Clostridium taeniosporum TaxID=394958 RepID=A0A1D7XJB7_9CLOT|nr:glycosyltransferase family 39 protein [Clostridium taeniosporum]AOR23416.1 dolichyl-phosphate-mannose--protein mannosyltransferase [Clostridium taeniosporum]
MNTKFSGTFTRIMNITIKSLLYVLLIRNLSEIVLALVGPVKNTILSRIDLNRVGFNKSSILLLFIGIICISIGYVILKTHISKGKKLIIILIIGFILRILWLLNIPSVPVSDFKLIYDTSINFLNGDRSMFQGTAYMSRFPHLTGMVLYMALMNLLFPIKSLLAMKIINLFLGLLDIILIYLITDLIFKNKLYAQISAFISAIFPPFITYTSVFCSENIAIPFYLLSIYLFIYYLRNKKNKSKLLMCGVILSLGNFFRTIATVVLIAYVLYIIIYSLDSIYERAKNILILVISYLLITIIISATLQNFNVLERPLWDAKEPKITSVLKGSNYENAGRWNEEDANFINEHLDNYDELKEKSKEIIVHRFTSHSILKTIIFILDKFTLQWTAGDFSGSMWAQMNVPEEQIKFPIVENEPLEFQLIYTIILILICMGLNNRKMIKSIKEVNLLYLILGGYGITYLIIEQQGRYSYICCYILIFLCIFGIDRVMQKYNCKSISKSK